MPGADGVVAMNYFVQQAKPDGLTLTTGDSPQIDPIRYRGPQSRYDPVKFEFLGGVGRGGSMIIMESAAEKRLFDRSAPPITMGIASAVPRSGQLMAAWGIGVLGWNAKWVVGYRSTSALMFALQQGEIEMTATSNTFSLQNLIDSGKFKVLTQSGGLQNGALVPRPEFPNAPLLSDQVAGKMSDPVAVQSFNYWRGVLLADKFLALPPGAPGPIAEAYRKAYREMSADPEFILHGRRISEVFAPMTDADIRSLVQTVAATPPRGDRVSRHDAAQAGHQRAVDQFCCRPGRARSARAGTHVTAHSRAKRADGISGIEHRFRSAVRDDCIDAFLADWSSAGATSRASPRNRAPRG